MGGFLVIFPVVVMAAGRMTGMSAPPAAITAGTVPLWTTLPDAFLF